MVENYKQALEILAGEAQFKRSMEDSGIKDTATFSQWLNDEREYLKSLSKEPIHETLQMEYYQKLVNLEDAQWVVLVTVTQNVGLLISYVPHRPMCLGRNSTSLEQQPG